MRRAALSIVCLLALAACSPGTGSSPAAGDDRRPTPSTVDPVAAPDRRVETFEVTWTDPTRPTPPHGGFAGAPDRTLRVRFYLPVGGSPAPLVVFAHGNNSVPEQYELPLQALARRGYAVAAPAYPSTNAEAPGGASPADLANQPADTTFVIDRILAADDGAGRLRNRIDTEHIAVAGHSIGGFTAGEAAFSDTCADDRVDAAIVMAAGFGGCAGSRAPDRAVPLLVIHGDADTTVPYALGRSAFAAANRPKYLLTVIGGSHSGDVRGGAGAGARAVDATVLAFLDATLRAAPAALDALRPIPGVTRWESRP